MARGPAGRLGRIFGAQAADSGVTGPGAASSRFSGCVPPGATRSFDSAHLDTESLGEPAHRTPRELGRRGERLAAAYLEERGWKVVGTGFLARRGEVDLVCRKGECLVLVEVKTRTGLGFGAPAEAVGPRKQRALSAAAAEYRALAGWRGEVRFAVVSLLLDRDGEVRSIELLEDPF